MTDATGAPLQVVRIPSPGWIDGPKNRGRRPRAT